MQSVEKILNNKEEIIRIFKTYDSEKNQTIKLSRLLRILERQSIDVKDKVFLSILNLFKINNDKKDKDNIDYISFIKFLEKNKELFKDYSLEDFNTSQEQSDSKVEISTDLIATKKESDLKAQFNPSKKERTKFFFYSLRKLIRRLVWKDLKIKIFDPIMRNIYFSPTDLSQFNQGKSMTSYSSLEQSQKFQNNSKTQEILIVDKENQSQTVTKQLYLDLPSIMTETHKNSHQLRQSQNSQEILYDSTNEAFSRSDLNYSSNNQIEKHNKFQNSNNFKINDNTLSKEQTLEDYKSQPSVSLSKTLRKQTDFSREGNNNNNNNNNSLQTFNLTCDEENSTILPNFNSNGSLHDNTTATYNNLNGSSTLQDYQQQKQSQQQHQLQQQQQQQQFPMVNSSSSLQMDKIETSMIPHQRTHTEAQIDNTFSELIGNIEQHQELCKLEQKQYDQAYLNTFEKGDTCVETKETIAGAGCGSTDRLQIDANCGNNILNNNPHHLQNISHNGNGILSSDRQVAQNMDMNMVKLYAERMVRKKLEQKLDEIQSTNVNILVEKNTVEMRFEQHQRALCKEGFNKIKLLDMIKLRILLVAKLRRA